MPRTFRRSPLGGSKAEILFPKPRLSIAQQHLAIGQFPDYRINEILSAQPSRGIPARISVGG